MERTEPRYVLQLLYIKLLQNEINFLFFFLVYIDFRLHSFEFQC